MADDQDHAELFSAIASMKTPEETGRLLRDLCTVSELDAMAHRWEVAQLLDEGLPYLEVAKRAHASTTTREWSASLRLSGPDSAAMTMSSSRAPQRPAK